MPPLNPLHGCSATFCGENTTSFGKKLSGRSALARCMLLWAIETFPNKESLPKRASQHRGQRSRKLAVQISDDTMIVTEHPAFSCTSCWMQMIQSDGDILYYGDRVTTGAVLASQDQQEQRRVNYNCPTTPQPPTARLHGHLPSTLVTCSRVRYLEGEMMSRQNDCPWFRSISLKC